MSEAFLKCCWTVHMGRHPVGEHLLQSNGPVTDSAEQKVVPRKNWKARFHHTAWSRWYSAIANIVMSRRTRNATSPPAVSLWAK